MAPKSLQEFLAHHNPDGTHPVTEIEVKTGQERNTSPFIIIRQDRRIVLVNPLAFGEYLDVDLHAFTDAGDPAAAMGVLGFTEGRRHVLEPTGLTRSKCPAVTLLAVLVGELG